MAPLKDTTCPDTGSQGGAFGPDCSGSALGNLYYLGLGQTFPNSIAPQFGVPIGPMQNLKLSYYWALQNNGGSSVVVPYTSGPAAGKAVYDCKTGYTWPANANLAASNSFGLTGNTSYCLHLAHHYRTADQRRRDAVFDGESVDPGDEYQ